MRGAYRSAEAHGEATINENDLHCSPICQIGGDFGKSRHIFEGGQSNGVHGRFSSHP